LAPSIELALLWLSEQLAAVVSNATIKLVNSARERYVSEGAAQPRGWACRMSVPV